MHDDIIDRTGGERGTLNPAAVASALERTRWGPFEGEGDLVERAALLLRGIVLDHPFADGNKRTAFEAADLFLRGNGAFVAATAPEIVDFMLACARGELEFEDIVGWLRAKRGRL